MIGEHAHVNILTAYRLLHPRPVVIVTARHEGRDNAMAASWVMPVSFNPPLVAVSIAPARFTHSLIEKSGVFALNVPGEDLLWCVNYVGSVSGEEEDKIEKLRRRGLRIADGRKVDVPVILDCLAVLECVVEAKHPAGDHTIFVGKIVEAYAREGTFVGGLYAESVSPLMHVGGPVYAVATKRLVV